METRTEGEETLLILWRARRKIGTVLALASSTFVLGYILAGAIACAVSPLAHAPN